MPPPPANWFLALVVPESAGLGALAGALPAGIRALAPADLHLTVAFLGPCGEERARRAWRAVAPLHHPPLSVRAGHWRAMGPPRRPSAWALGLAAGDAVAARLIARWREPALAAAGLPPETRPPLPHITLARPPRGGDAATRAALREAMALWLPQAPLPDEALPLEEIALWTRADAPRAGGEGSGRFRIAARRRLDAPTAAAAKLSPADHG